MSTPWAPRAIEVENLRKYFTLPALGTETEGAFKRLLHPLKHARTRTLRVLDGISFEVEKGEMFGIIGRNGSGKTTLLRILGSIYRPDSGRVRMAGNVAPFIDLGVGFQPQMSARQNVAINGVMLGLDRRDTRRRVDAVLDYAELRDFGDVQLKYFSSGMRGRLAFASMRQTDPDVYLLDEILASGDEEFREKTGGEFAALNKRGKTIVLVTHGRGAIEELAHRAMWISDGKVAALGEPKEVLDAYRAERLARLGKSTADEAESKRGAEDRERNGARARPPRATIETLVLENGAGSDLSTLGAGEAIRLLIEVKASGWVKAPTLVLAVKSEDGVEMFASRDSDVDRLPALKPGEGLVAEATLENSLAPGRYRLECNLSHGDDRGAVSPTRAIGFEVDGVAREGVVALERSVVLRPATSLEPIR
jgi:ABC-2 type transport system ATP-binding protein